MCDLHAFCAILHSHNVDHLEMTDHFMSLNSRTADCGLADVRKLTVHSKEMHSTGHLKSVTPYYTYMRSL